MANMKYIPEWLPEDKLSIRRCGKCREQGHLGNFGYHDDGTRRKIICPNCNGHGVVFSIREIEDNFKVVPKDG